MPNIVQSKVTPNWLEILPSLVTDFLLPSLVSCFPTLSVIGVGATMKEHVSGPCRTISFTLWRNGTYLVQGNKSSTKYLLFT